MASEKFKRKDIFLPVLVSHSVRSCAPSAGEPLKRHLLCFPRDTFSSIRPDLYVLSDEIPQT